MAKQKQVEKVDEAENHIFVVRKGNLPALTFEAKNSDVAVFMYHQKLNLSMSNKQEEVRVECID